MDFQSWISDHVGKLEAQGLLRRPLLVPRIGPEFIRDGRSVVNFASNDYLNLAQDSRLISGGSDAMEKFGAGSASARLLSGTTALHTGLEAAIAELFNRESAVLYSSGYLANLGAITAGRGRNDAVISDRLIHASLVDGIRLSGMKHYRFRHNDADHAEEMLLRARAEATGRLLLVTESVFSMNGDIAPLDALAELARRHGADFLVDEAHAVGVLPAGSRGDIVTGTLSKAFGAYGGFVCGGASLPPFLNSLSRPYIFNTSLPPAVCAAALEAIRIVREAPQLGETLLLRAQKFRKVLESAGLDCLGSETQIVPLAVGDREKALALSGALLERGIFAPAIRPPTVPPGEERLRFSITLGISEAELDRCAGEIIDASRRLGIC